MSRSSRQKQKAKNTVARSKADYPTRWRAIRSLRRAGIEAHRLTKSHHTGTYWRWEIRIDPAPKRLMDRFNV